MLIIVCHHKLTLSLQDFEAKRRTAHPQVLFSQISRYCTCYWYLSWAATLWPWNIWTKCSVSQMWVFKIHTSESGPNWLATVATVSKIPPTPDEVSRFIALVDGLRAEMKARGDSSLIACHCHYGFNRTGFFLVSYMIERLGYDVAQAIAEFKKARPPGIRHPHFITELFERYDCPGLRRPSFSWWRSLERASY